MLIRGVGFVSKGSAFCVFGQGQSHTPFSTLSSTLAPALSLVPAVTSALTPARVLNTTAIECETPPVSVSVLSPPGPVPVAVGVVLDGYLVMNDGSGLVDVSNGLVPGSVSGSGSGSGSVSGLGLSGYAPPVSFTYMSPATVHSVHPLTGSVSGGTVLTVSVSGAGYVFGATIRCRFGETPTLSTYLLHYLSTYLATYPHTYLPTYTYLPKYLRIYLSIYLTTCLLTYLSPPYQPTYIILV